MAISQKRATRKSTGGRYTNTNPKRLSNLGFPSALTHIGGARVKDKKVRGGNVKKSALSIDTANLLNPKTGKHSKAKIEKVEESSANRNYVRRNIITRGTVVKTSKGKAKVTNRPSQEGFINAVLLQE